MDDTISNNLNNNESYMKKSIISILLEIVENLALYILLKYQRSLEAIDLKLKQIVSSDIPPLFSKSSMKTANVNGI